MTRVLAALTLVLALSCGSPDPAEGTIEGLITEASDESVTVVPEGGGEAQTFVNGATEQVPTSHLEEHRVKELPVILHWERQDGRRVAVRIDDA